MKCYCGNLSFQNESVSNLNENSEFSTKSMLKFHICPVFQRISTKNSNTDSCHRGQLFKAKIKIRRYSVRSVHIANEREREFKHRN